MAELVRQLLQADKVVHEQQLGWSWVPPDDALFTPSGLSKPAQPATTASTGGEGAEGSGEGDGGQPQEELTEEEAAARQAEAELQARLQDARYTGALNLLVDEAGFLVEAKVRNMLERLPKDEAGKVAAESIVRSLGIADGTGFEALVSALSADSSIELRAKVGNRVMCGGRMQPYVAFGRARLKGWGNHPGNQLCTAIPAFK